MFSQGSIHYSHDEKHSSHWELSSLATLIAKSGTDRLIVSDNSNNIYVLSRSTGECEKIFATSSPATTLLVRKNGTLASGHVDGSICVWDLTTLTLTTTIPGDPRNSVRALAEQRNGHLVSGHHNGAVSIWDVEQRSRVTTNLDQVDNPVNALTVCPKTDEVISGHANGNLQFWHPASKKVVTKTPSWLSQLFSSAGSLAINCLTAFPNGRIASADASGTIKIWNRARSITTTCQATSAVRSLSVQSKKHLVSCTAARIDTWDIQTGRTVATPGTVRAGSSVACLDAELVATTSANGIHIRRLPHIPRKPEAVLEGSAQVHPMELSTFFVPSPRTASVPSEKKVPAVQTQVVSPPSPLR